MNTKKALISLAIGGFGIGLTEFVIMGILPEVAAGLNITIPTAGHFISAYALGVVIGAPLLTMASKRWKPKTMLLILMVWFTIFNSLSAISSSYLVMLIMRFLSGLPHGAFFGIGAIVATKLAKKGKAAQAIATMFAGLTVANVVGVPLGTFLGQQYDWSVSFALVGIVGVITLFSLALWMPNLNINIDSKSESENKPVFKNGQLWSLIALTTIGTGGFFAWYSYIAPLIKDVANLPDQFVGYAMIISGLGMVIGNFLGAKMSEKLSPIKSVVISMIAMSLLLILNALIAFNPIAVLTLAFVIGLVTFTLAAPLQIAIINSSNGSEMLGSSMNQSAFNMGNASGAYFAGLPMAMGYGITSASLVGAILAGSGVVIAILILNFRKQQSKTRAQKLAHCS